MVQALINQSLSERLVGDINDRLQGLKNAVVHYQATLTDGEPATAKAEWIALQSIFNTSQPFFQHNDSDGDYRVLLLPEFAQFTMLYLGILRDAVVAAAAWQWSARDLAQRKVDLTKKIAEVVNYANTVYNLGLASKQTTASDAHACEPFRTINTSVRYMTTCSTM
jgi:hypothetical protein